ncbi:MerR family transcriptional regulator [Nocardioides insulae]|uniref:MerR family transcriptional regulator n=1 Tax=Nocardioides insulae TaxID=394734 RepID=UPI000415207C|nr:MerR family transcriptional regulator [Nocardioides insulae]
MTDQLTVDQLAAESGLSVRTTRYYASRGLIPPPVRRGRVAYYGAAHTARLELVRAMQEHGFTLQAIERYLARLPADITPADLAMQRAMVSSWATEDPEEAYRRIGRELRDLGLPRDALAAAQEATVRHMSALADELNVLLRDQVVDPFRRTHHTAEEAEHLEESLPRLRELTVEVVVASFQAAMNDVVGRALTGEGDPDREQI